MFDSNNNNSNNNSNHTTTTTTTTTTNNNNNRDINNSNNSNNSNTSTNTSTNTNIDAGEVYSTSTSYLHKPPQNSLQTSLTRSSNKLCPIADTYWGSHYLRHARDPTNMELSTWLREKVEYFSQI